MEYYWLVWCFGQFIYENVWLERNGINMESLRKVFKETLDNNPKSDEGLNETVKMGDDLDFIDF